MADLLILLWNDRGSVYKGVGVVQRQLSAAVTTRRSACQAPRDVAHHSASAGLTLARRGTARGLGAPANRAAAVGRARAVVLSQRWSVASTTAWGFHLRLS